MPLRIAFDLDGVLADMESALIHHARLLFGDAAVRPAAPRPDFLRAPAAAETAAAAAAATAAVVDLAATEANPPPPDHHTPDDVPVLTHIELTARQERKLWRHVEAIPDFWESLHEIEAGVVSRLAQIATDRRWEVIFLTRRPEGAGATSQLQTQRWLARKGFPLPSVFVVQRSRGRIADALALDVVVDDRPENCLDVVVDSRARAVLVWRDDQALLPIAARRLGIAVVTSTGECLDALDQSSDGEMAQGTVVDRLMRMLGLRQPPSD